MRLRHCHQCGLRNCPAPGCRKSNFEFSEKVSFSRSRANLCSSIESALNNSLPPSPNSPGRTLSLFDAGRQLFERRSANAEVETRASHTRCGHEYAFCLNARRANGPRDVADCQVSHPRSTRAPRYRRLPQVHPAPGQKPNQLRNVCSCGGQREIAAHRSRRQYDVSCGGQCHFNDV